MFICTGNICRSAMAEKLLKQKLETHGLEKEWAVYSAGTNAYKGDMPTYEAVKVMHDLYGIDLKTHRATRVLDSNIREMDLILCMTASHKNTLQSLFPELQEKIFMLGEYVGRKQEIADPYGGTLETYTRCAGELEECLELLIKKEAKK